MFNFKNMDSEIIYALAKKIPRGKVTTYGELARLLGGRKYSRKVGSILNKNSNPEVPCHRVVYSDGKVGGFRRGQQEKIKILREEGLEIKGEKIVNFEKVLFRFQ